MTETTHDCVNPMRPSIAGASGVVARTGELQEQGVVARNGLASARRQFSAQHATLAREAAERRARGGPAQSGIRERKSPP
ncbi:hypothetical protein MTE01_14050 [Microbacterium testaceum]|uniref:Uncharacterized protein n=1 Tax=Microbacterium testaceum TaxID=2033 RepID=A0A4Y3QMV0_MICTE|nr:hypothetical protein MTE01_14050 [Microbacterium testaceum]